MRIAVFVLLLCIINASSQRKKIKKYQMEKNPPPTNNDTMVTAETDVSGGALQRPAGGLACELDDLTCISRTYKVSYLFPTPLFYQTIVTDQKGFNYNKDIKALLLDLEEENDGCKFNLHGGYRSKDGFLNRREDEIVWLRHEIESRVRIMLALSGAPNTPFFVDGWGAVLRAGHGQTQHVHPQSIFAGVYYGNHPFAAVLYTSIIHLTTHTNRHTLLRMHYLYPSIHVDLHIPSCSTRCGVEEWKTIRMFAILRSKTR